jgi:hypothetical protein
MHCLLKKKALFTGIEVVCDSATSTPITHNYSRSKSSMRNGPLRPAGPHIPITIIAHRIFTRIHTLFNRLLNQPEEFFFERMSALY